MQKRILGLVLVLVTVVSLCMSLSVAAADSEADVATMAAQLAAPKLSSVSNAANGVTIAWGKVPGAAKYRVFYKTNGGSWKKIADTASTSYTWTGAQSGTKYAFTVRCVNSAGTAFTSAYDTAGKSITYVAAPKLSSVTNAANGVTVTWGKVSGAAKYRVFYKTSGGSWKKIADTTSTSYTWTGAKSGTKYAFTVRCVNSAGTAFTSAYDTTGKSITYMTAPKLSSVTNAVNGVTVAWGKVPGAAKYRVFCKTSGGSWKKIADTSSTSYTWTGAKSGAKYAFTVRCVNSAGTAFTSAYDTAGKSITYVAAPKLSSVTSVDNGVTIVWGKVSGAAKYRVFCKTDGDSWKKIVDTTSTSYTWTGAQSGVKYAFTVRCVDSAGAAFTSGYDTAGKSITYVAVPKLSSVTNGIDGVTVKWGKVPGAAKYRVFYKTSGGSWTKIADTTSTSYTWSGAQSGTKYAFTVRCVNSAGTAYTSAFDKTGKSTTYYPLDTPKNFKAEYYYGDVRLSWNPVDGADYYIVVYRIGNYDVMAPDWEAIDWIYLPFMYVENARSGVKYTFVVVARDFDDHESDYAHYTYTHP